MDRIPLHVGRLSFTEIWNPNLSIVTSQRTPSARSRVGFSKSRFLTESALSDSGTDFNTFIELDLTSLDEIHLVTITAEVLLAAH